MIVSNTKGRAPDHTRSHLAHQAKHCLVPSCLPLPSSFSSSSSSLPSLIPPPPFHPFPFPPHHLHATRSPPGFLLPHDEDDEARSPFPKGMCSFPFPLPSYFSDLPPIIQDTLDLFATLVVSLQLTTHKQFFRSFPNSFSTCVLFISLYCFCPLSPLCSLSSTFFFFVPPAMKQPRTLLLSNSLNPIVDQTLENPHE